MRLLDLDGGAHVELAVEAGVVPPPHPFEGRELNLLDRPPRAGVKNELVTGSV